MAKAILIASGLLILLTGLACQKNQPEVPTHVTALIEFSDEGSRVLFSVSQPHPLTHDHEAPTLTPENLDEAQHGDSEWVVAVHEEDGDVIKSHGFQQQARVHGCRPALDGKGYEGGSYRAQKQYQLVSIPLPKDSAYLTMHKAEVTRDADGSDNHVVHEADGLALQTQNHGALALHASVAPDSSDKTTDHYLESDHPDTSDWTGPSVVLTSPFDLSPKAYYSNEVPEHNGFIKSAGPIIKNGDPESLFNIVIMAEGFAENEVDEYRTLAQNLASNILTHEPFKSLRDSINIYSIVSVSDESGITGCTDDRPRKTYFSVHGSFDFGAGPSYPAFLGTHFPEVILFTANHVIDWRRMGLCIVIGNCDTPGGSGFPSPGVCFVTKGNGLTDVAEFGRFAQHEIGHALGHLAEEYVSGFPDHLMKYPNMARKSDIENDTVPWKHLAKPEELTADGQFKYQHHFGEPFALPHNFPCQPKLSIPLPPDDPDVIGLFWGCQNLDRDVPISEAGDPAHKICGYMDDRGTDFYRPAIDCRMRSMVVGYCRVCRAAIADRIRARMVSGRG